MAKKNVTLKWIIIPGFQVQVSAGIPGTLKISVCNYYIQFFFILI